MVLKLIVHPVVVLFKHRREAQQITRGLSVFAGSRPMLHAGIKLSRRKYSKCTSPGAIYIVFTVINRRGHVQQGTQSLLTKMRSFKLFDVYADLFYQHQPYFAQPIKPKA